jgi:hypothetical protein
MSVDHMAYYKVNFFIYTIGIESWRDSVTVDYIARLYIAPRSENISKTWDMGWVAQEALLLPWNFLQEIAQAAIAVAHCILAFIQAISRWPWSVLLNQATAGPRWNSTQGCDDPGPIFVPEERFFTPGIPPRVGMLWLDLGQIEYFYTESWELLLYKT